MSSEHTIVATYDGEGQITLPLMPIFSAAGLRTDDDIEVAFEDDGTLVIRCLTRPKD
jgi:hypothetical protein